MTWRRQTASILTLRIHPHSMRAARRRTQPFGGGFAMIERVRVPVLAALLVVGLSTPALAQKPVKIGVLTPLSPPGDAAAGQFIVRGAKMGAEDVNARGGVLGGRKIELVIEDGAGTPEKGAAGFRKLATHDPGGAVVGQVHNSAMTA